MPRALWDGLHPRCSTKEGKQPSYRGAHSTRKIGATISPFSLSIVHICTEDCKVLDGGVSMHLASNTFWHQTLLLLDRRDLCRVFADVSGCVRRVDWMMGKKQRIEGQTGSNWKTGGWMCYCECAIGNSWNSQWWHWRCSQKLSIWRASLFCSISCPQLELQSLRSNKKFNQGLDTIGDNTLHSSAFQWSSKLRCLIALIAGQVFFLVLLWKPHAIHAFMEAPHTDPAHDKSTSHIHSPF